DSYDDGSLRTFDFVFLPLALAYAKRGLEMKEIASTMRAALERADGDLWERCSRALGRIGYYYPREALTALRPFMHATRDSAMRSPIVNALGMIRTLHPDIVDDFLTDVGAAELRPLVQAGADF